MTDTDLKSNLILFAEILLVFSGLGYASYQFHLDRNLLILLLIFSSLIFSVYYGVKGTMLTVAASLVLSYFLLKDALMLFITENYIETSFFLATLLIVGFAKSSMNSRVAGMSLSNEVLNHRLERLTVELSEKDKALQEAFQEVLTDMESPKIMYQALRRIETIDDRETLFNEILYILYTHCHVEKSGIYEVKSGRRFVKTAVFGATQLPEEMAWNQEMTPEIMKACITEGEVILPTRLHHRQTMAIPILSISGKISYMLYIEEIRFINFNENLIQLLKVAAYWVKHLIEHRLHMNALLVHSIFSEVVVYKPEISRELLKRNLKAHRRYHLPCALLEVEDGVDEKKALAISKAVRIYDDLLSMGDNRLIVFLSMVKPEHVPFVLNRLKSVLPGVSIQATEPQRWR